MITHHFSNPSCMTFVMEFGLDLSVMNICDRFVIRVLGDGQDASLHLIHFKLR